ncbi:MAG: DUF3575 domain-containing protein [Bacteroidales bacterium]|nr:DUF3575 domain-containing protein [Bacteroidales bacterium]
MKRLIPAVLLMMMGTVAGAQKITLSTNILEWMELGTMNVEASVAAARHISVGAGVKWNPWTYKAGDPETQAQNRQLVLNAGMRYWPWHIFSGWWMGAKGQYATYNIGGIWSRETEEGDAFGLGFGGGYTLLLTSALNLDFGIGAWTGTRTWIRYSCPRCGQVLENGSGLFVLPNELLVSLVYVF